MLILAGEAEEEVKRAAVTREVWMLITICAQLSNAFGDSPYANIFDPHPNAFWDPLMRSVIPIWKIFHNGLVLLISHMRTITKCIRLVTEPVPKCIWGSPYAFGDIAFSFISDSASFASWSKKMSPNVYGESPNAFG